MVTKKQPRTFAERLKHFRENRGWSQVELGAYSGLGQPTISQYESGSRENPRGAAMNKLATALGVSVSDLISDEVVSMELPAMATPAINELAKRVAALEKRSDEHSQAIRRTNTSVGDLQKALRERPKSQSASTTSRKK